MQIFSDLKSLSPTNTLIAVNTNILTTQTRLSLGTASTNSIYYTQNGLPLGQSASPDTIFLANITVEPNTPVGGLARVQATIETPANATATNRSRYIFVTLMRQ